MKKNLLISIVATGLVLLIIVNVISVSGQLTSKNTDFVPDPETAKAIAEVIWHTNYGESIKIVKPFKAKLIRKNVWQVSSKDSTIFIELQRSDCKILKVWIDNI